jgi:hypothetical protein
MYTCVRTCTHIHPHPRMHACCVGKLHEFFKLSSTWEAYLPVAMFHLTSVSKNKTSSWQTPVDYSLALLFISCYKSLQFVETLTDGVVVGTRDWRSWTLKTGGLSIVCAASINEYGVAGASKAQWGKEGRLRQRVFDMGDSVNGDLSRRDRGLASRTLRPTGNLSQWRQTYSPYHFWNWTLSSMLELEEVIAVWGPKGAEKEKENAGVRFHVWQANKGLFWTIF